MANLVTVGVSGTLRLGKCVPYPLYTFISEPTISKLLVDTVKVSGYKEGMKEPKHFGQMIATERNAQRLTVEQLSARTKARRGNNVASSTISLLETGKVGLSSLTGITLIDALEIPEARKRAFIDSLQDYIENWVQPHNYPRTGAVLTGIVERYDLIPLTLIKDIAQATGSEPFTYTYMSALITGKRAASSLVFKALIERVLPKYKVKKSDITELIHAYTYEVFMNDSKFDFIHDKKRVEVAESLADLVAGQRPNHK